MERTEGEGKERGIKRGKIKKIVMKEGEEGKKGTKEKRRL